MTKALAMISGGLDSILAAKLIKEQGIEEKGICVKSDFLNLETNIDVLQYFNEKNNDYVNYDASSELIFTGKHKFKNYSKQFLMIVIRKKFYC